jgi:hypothetical protein
MAKITWTIKGKLKVRSQFEEIKTSFGDANGDVPLAGVKVRVSAKESKLDPSGFDKWGEVTTKEDGSFQFTISKDKSKRYFKVEVLFDGKDTRIYPGTLVDLPGSSGFEKGVNAFVFDVDWILVWQDEEKKGPGVVDFRNITFSDSGGEQLNGRDERCHADLWFIAGKVRSELENVGQGLGFPSQPVVIKYPHSDPIVPDDPEMAYADPIRNMVFLIRNGVVNNFELQTIIHELIHLRNYAHSTGEEELASELLAKGTTHDGKQEKTWTGFHEASAEIFKNELYHRMFGKRAVIYRDPSFEAERRPFTRTWLKNTKGIKKLKDIDHFEHGWMSVFNLLLCNKVEQLDMNGAGPYAREKAATGTGPKLAIARKTVNFSFADLLRAFDVIFNPVPDEFPKQIDLSEMTLNKYFQRLGALVPAFDATMQSAYKKILDPAETKQPSDLLPVLIPKISTVGRP